MPSKNCLHALLMMALAISLAGCGETKTTSTTVNNPDGSQTTTTVEKKGFEQKTTVTTTPAPDGISGTINGKPIDIQIGENGDSGLDKVHVRGPGIKIDANDNSDNVDVNLPFVKVRKDGGKVHVRAPFVDIHADEH
ncbi:MAG TPA: hypothetical protein V6C89_03155 [Drouetiella sp.]|jgi:hypothetical protein